MRPVTQIGKEADGTYRILVDGKPDDGRYEDLDSAADAARKGWGKLSLMGGVVRLDAGKEEDNEVSEEVKAALARTVGEFCGYLDEGRFDEILEELYQAELAGKNRRGVLSALEARGESVEYTG
jgi:hypothetical protein